MSNKKVSMQTIADYLNISKVTVYKALNNQQYVSDDLKEKILRAAQELGYYKVSGKNLALNNNLAFVVPKRFFLENEGFYTSIFYYLNNFCHNDGLALTLYVINNSDESNCTLPATLNSGSCDGIFIAGEMTDDYIHGIGDLGLPVLLIDFYKPSFNYDCIIADNFFNGFTITNYLIEKGHTDIGFVGNPSQTSSISDRFYGYQKALAAHNLPYNPDWHLVNNNLTTGVYTLETPLPKTLPTAFVCHCDRAAYFLIQRINMEGLKVPADISVACFDNTNLAENSNPPLTTVDISTKTIAKNSYSQLRSRIKDNSLSKQRIYIPCNIVERSSVANIKKII
ncbi:LacI family DNA-binding transcriptional regulator [Anaerocolumna xylanovorans]|uniref:Transcriptional regulator, LacI family n=1 Tax=Anaerocolumna xylanovorans DSM 12503 TaxID=1121345 RepID=A0A1M7Y9T1_9FIRM|nr:LacI family DNA-binding transcriptional regulator [Anaerocolumna xylanovorans]SHO49326.1 transcriptional regulator, LacI family [Anaerocolumna xylanovorans DSM 12503]